MTERERWTVYPLLFLALGASIKDKLVPTDEIETARIRCQQVEIVDREHEVQARLDANMLVAPRLVTRDARILGTEDQTLIGMGINANGAPRIELFGQDRKPVLMLATDEENTTGMVITFDAQDQPHFMITASVRHKDKTETDDPGGNTASDEQPETDEDNATTESSDHVPNETESHDETESSPAEPPSAEPRATADRPDSDQP